MASDADSTNADAAAALNLVRRILPVTCDDDASSREIATADAEKEVKRLTAAEEHAVARQYTISLIDFARLICVEDPCRWLSAVLRNETLRAELARAKVLPARSVALAHASLTLSALEGTPELEEEANAIWAQMQKEEGSSTGVADGLSEPVSADVASMVRDRADAALKQLAENEWAAFVRGRSSASFLEQFLKTEGHDYFTRDRLLSELWSGYTVPSDAGGFLPGLVLFGINSRANITVADMQIPGAPLIFVNERFTSTTGYTRADALGRSCRFLQGEHTEPEAVSSIITCLAQGVDCHVKLTNYRKDSSTFVNLLTLRPIHDTCGVYRYVVGISTELSTDAFEWHLRVVEPVPTLMPVSSTRAVGRIHKALSTRMTWKTTVKQSRAEVIASKLSERSGNRRSGLATMEAADKSEKEAAEALKSALRQRLESVLAGQILTPGSHELRSGSRFVAGAML